MNSLSVICEMPNMKAGQNSPDPLTSLNGYMGRGLMARYSFESK